VTEQPFSVQITMPDGIFVKSMCVAKAGTVIPQHAHAYEHSSFVALGSVRVWKDGVLLGDFSAPRFILIPPRTKHRFQTLEDGTIVFCIHNISRTGAVEIAEEHHLAEGV
jgi:quercetin dioxygenase-like cupin family protein